MTYNKKELEKMALAVIKGHSSMVFIEELLYFMPCSRSTFYSKRLDKLDTIRDELSQNKLRTKMSLRENWSSPLAAGKNQETLYRLIGTQEERDAMNPAEKVDITGKIIIPPTQIEYIIRKTDAAN